jgi:hypothetical protein
MPGRFEEPACVIDRPGLTLPAPGHATVGELDGCDRIPADDLIFDSAGKRRAERIAGIFAASRGKHLMAASADGAASALALWPGSILALRAAQAGFRQLVEPLPDVLDLELVEPLAAQVRNDVKPGERLILLVRLRREIRFDYLFQPVGEEFG